MAAQGWQVAEEPTMLHVRGVGGHGGAYEDEVKLTELFGKHGAVHQVTIRHREDAHSGENTSWALVTMGSAEGGATDSECGSLHL